MLRLARISIKQPKLALGAWSVVAVVLVLIGLGVSHSLSPSVTVVPGTESSRAQQLADAQFGPSQLVPILLQGPEAQLDKQGPALVRALTKRSDTRVMSAWDGGAVAAELRKSATAAMIVLSVARSESYADAHSEPQIEATVSKYISSPVKAYVTGEPSIDRAEKNASLANLRRDELIAIGILFLLLLIGLRAPVAAVVVTAVGAISTLAGFGEVALLGKVITLDPVAVALGTMTGLALSSGFALFILDRFHRERDPGRDYSHDAAAAAVHDLQTTGKAVLVAGTALVTAIVAVAIIGPATLMISVGAGMLTCALFAVGGAVVVMPAGLVLLGSRIDAFRFPAPPLLVQAWNKLVIGGNAVTRYALVAGAIATAALGAIAVPAFALKSGPPSISELPANSQARIAFEHVDKVMGAGFATPYDLIVVPRGEPVTTPAFLARVVSFQAQIAKNPAVDSVTGPASINSNARQLQTFEPSLNHSMKISDQSKKQLVQLINGLAQAGSGSAQLQSGLTAASTGAGEIQSNEGTAAVGAGTIHGDLAKAAAGSSELASGLHTALAAAIELRNGAATALTGASKLSSGLGKGAPQIKAGLPAVATLATDSLAADTELKALTGQTQGVQGSLATALADLRSMTTGQSDPKYTAALNALQSADGNVGALNAGLGSALTDAGGAAVIASGVKSQVDALAPQLTQAATGAADLAIGLGKLHAGNAELAAGIRRAVGAGGELSGGLSQLTSGAGQLASGLGELTSGAGTLASGLASGVSPAGELTSGLGTMKAAVIKSRGQIPSTAQLKQLEAQSPGLFSSGYFVLAAVAGTSKVQRADASFMLNVESGGTAAQIMVVPSYGSGDARTLALGPALVKLGERFASRNHAQVAVGGPMGSLGDLTNVTKSHVWLDVAVLALAIVLTLMLALRAFVLPIVTTAFSLLVAGAAFGVLQILFGGSNPPLGGPGYMDPMTIIGVFTVAFGITTVFSTILLMRTREAFVSGDRRAVQSGLRETAAATTGAGLVMVAVLVPFATTSMINVRQFGIGVAVAVLLEVLIVRPVLVPAAEAALGRFGWWPTHVQRPDDLSSSAAKVRRFPHLHLPQRRPQPAHN
jgi:X-X-X-Leu-X-X-Gly heptad repeat protein